MPLLSVIIPVFNAAPHLDRCIASLLAQTLTDAEFIFVDDGSTDDSALVIKKSQQMDGRIKLISQKNQGVSSARNVGLDMSQGTYIGFLDADDYLQPEHFDTLIELAQAQQADIVCSRYFLLQQGREIVSPAIFPEGQKLAEDFIASAIVPHFIGTENLNAIWTKIYRRSLLEAHHIRFPHGVALGEDGLFNIEAYRFAKTVFFTGYAGYHYTETAGSATRNLHSKDYFGRILEEFKHDYSSLAGAHLTLSQIEALQTTKFLNKSLSLLYQYAENARHLGYRKSYRKIKDILENETWSAAIKAEYPERIRQKSRYQKLILWAAKNKWIPLLFVAAAYSSFKNK